MFGFFGELGVLCFLETPVLRLALFCSITDDVRAVRFLFIICNDSK